jgi:hypothetical protein
MNLERVLVRAKARVTAGDRAGAQAELDVALGVVRSRKKRRALLDGEQLVLPVVVIECAVLHAPVTLEGCRQRRGACWPSGGRKGAPKDLRCSTCALGSLVELSCPGVHLRPASQPAEVMSPLQRAAKRAKALITFEPGEHWAMEPMREVAMMTPDDRDLP